MLTARMIRGILLTTAALAVSQSAHADVAASYTATLRANNLGKFCIAFDFDDQEYTPFGTGINFFPAGDMICDGTSNGVTVTIDCKSYPDDSYISFGGSGPAGSTPQALVGSALPFVMPVPDTATGSLMTALGPGLTYTFDATVVIQLPPDPPDTPVTILGCTVPAGTPGTKVLLATGGGGLSVVEPLSTDIGAPTIATVATHLQWDPGTATNVEHSSEITVSFGDVSVAGDTTIFSASSLPGQFPTNFTVAAGDYTAFFFDVSTTASYTTPPPIRVCASYDDDDENGGLGDGYVDGVTPPLDETRLEVLHLEGTPPQYVYHPSAGGTDYALNRICADVDSLSPFVLAVAVDGDGDGVFQDDNCPTTANADQLDADGDGVGDACDGCASDPAKTDPGVCGCGAADADADGDGILNCLDPCHNTGARDITIKPKLAFKRINTDETDGNDGLQIQGEFVSGTPFGALDPLNNGVRILARTADGSQVVDILIPAGMGWESKGGTKWQYKACCAQATNNGGITKIQIADRSKKAPNQLKIQVVGTLGTYGVTTGDEPVNATVVIGDGSIGECGETRFGPGQCTFNGSANALKCK